MGLRYRFLGAALRASCFGFRVEFGFGVAYFGFQIADFGFRVADFGFRVANFGFRIAFFGFRAPDFGVRVSGLGDWGIRGALSRASAEGRESVIRMHLLLLLLLLYCSSSLELSDTTIYEP